jgi:hypothetical protein
MGISGGKKIPGKGIVGSTGHEHLPSPKQFLSPEESREFLLKALKTSCTLYSVTESSAQDGKKPGENVYTHYQLRYDGQGMEISHSLGGAAQAVEVAHDARLAILEVKKSRFFQNRLLAELLRMHSLGAPQGEMHEYMRGFFIRRGALIPTYDTVKANAGPQPKGRNPPEDGFEDTNPFLLWIEAEDYLKGLHVSNMLIGQALRENYLAGSRYAVAYTRMAGFSGYSGTKSTASLEEATGYLEGQKKRPTDWSLRFHMNCGADILFSLPDITEDPESRNAGAMAVYDLERLYLAGKLQESPFKREPL